MSVLLTGGAGFIGSHTAVELLSRGREIVIADDFSNAGRDIIDRIEKISGKRPPLYELDVADAAALKRVFEEQEIDSVMHFAGFKAVGESVTEPLKYYRNNLGTTITLLETMRDYGVRRVVFSSSATVYSMDNPVPYSEDMPSGGCTNPYGRTKYMIEEIMRDVSSADSTLSVVLLRYFNPIGAHESGLLGERPQGVPNNLMPYITQTAAGIRQRLSVFGNDYPTPDGTGVRDYIHITDLAAGHAAALDYAEEHSGCEVFNLGTGVGYSVLDVVNTFSRVNGVEVPYVIAPRRSGDIAEFYADPEKAERVLGWRARKSLEDMCRDAWRWQIQLGSSGNA